MNTVRALTWNIHGTFGRNPRFDLARVVALIDRWDPQIVALQEVDSRRDGGIDPFEYLQRELGEHGIGAKSITTADGEYGQMLIIRWPMSETEIHDLSYPEREPRRAIATRIETPHGPLRVVATHLGLSVHERREQAEKLIAIAGNSAMPTIIMATSTTGSGSARCARRSRANCPAERVSAPSRRSFRCCASTASTAGRTAHSRIAIRTGPRAPCRTICR